MRYLLIFLALCVGHSTLAAAKQPGDVVRLEMDCSATKNKQAGPWKHDFYGLITDNGLSFVGHWAHRSSRDPGEVFFNSFDGRINEAKRSAAIKGSIRRVKKSWVNEWFFKKDNVSSLAEALAGAGMKGRGNKGEWQRQCTMRLIKSGSVADALGNFKQLADDRQQRLITINRDLNKLRDQAADAKAETKRLNSRVATLNAQLFGTKKRIENLEADLAKSQSTPAQTKQLADARKDVRSLRRQLVKAQEALEERTADARRLKSDLQTATKRLKAETKQLADLRESSASADDLKQQRDLIVRLETQISSFEADIRDLRAERDRAQDGQAEARAELAATQSELTKTSTNMGQMAMEVMELNKKLNLTEEQLQGTDRSAEIARLEAQVMALQADLVKSDDALKASQATLTEAIERVKNRPLGGADDDGKALKSAKAEIKQLQEKITKLNKDVTSKDKEITQWEADYSKRTKELVATGEALKAATKKLEREGRRVTKVEKSLKESKVEIARLNTKLQDVTATSKAEGDPKANQSSTASEQNSNARQSATPKRIKSSLMTLGAALYKDPFLATDLKGIRVQADQFFEGYIDQGNTYLALGGDGLQCIMNLTEARKFMKIKRGTMVAVEGTFAGVRGESVLTDCVILTTTEAEYNAWDKATVAYSHSYIISNHKK